MASDADRQTSRSISSSSRAAATTRSDCCSRHISRALNAMNSQLTAARPGRKVTPVIVRPITQNVCSKMKLWHRASESGVSGRMMLLGAGLGADESFQASFVADEQRRAAELGQLFLTKFTQNPGDRLAGATDQLRNFFVGKRNLDANPIFGAFAVRSPLQQQ